MCVAVAIMSGLGLGWERLGIHYRKAFLVLWACVCQDALSGVQGNGVEGVLGWGWGPR